MSLINQLLQDLEKRRASGAETRSLSPPVRALPSRAKRSTLMVAALLVVTAGAVLYAYSEYAKRSTTRIAAPPQKPATLAVPIAPAPVAPRPVAPAPAAAPPAQEALVREALEVPVFQFARELQFTPSSPSAKPPVTRSKAAPKPAASRRPGVAAAQGASRQNPTQSAASASTNPATASDVEEIVIPETASPLPVEKQMREPTAYERAEVEFRNAVARLRQGRVVDAEAGFRAALKEDRSHSASRQALIGLLIDSGRHKDAEEVLRETLAVNPRQPRHSMLLARLELERGDTAGAARTLEAARPYAGVDAEFFAFLAAVYQRLGRHQEATEYYANALAVVPGNAVWMMGLGISLQALQRNQEARAAFRSAADSKTLGPELQAFVNSRLRELSVSKR